MENKRLTSATIAASPTLISWSQAYTAGALFVVLSLRYQNQKPTEETSLATIGKEILNTLEAEYFTIETKDLFAVKQAFEIAIKSSLEKETFLLSAGLLSVVDNVLYVVLYGNAKARMKRDNTLGMLLASEEKVVVSASGFLHDLDTVILETASFTNTISKEQLKKAIDNNTPSEIAENISPLLHEQEEGGAAAVVISYKEPSVEAIKTEEVVDEMPKPKKEFGKIVKSFVFTSLNTSQQILRPMIGRIKASLNRKQKLSLIFAVVLLLLLLGSGFFVIKQKETAKNEALFQEVFEKAKTKYDEGESLLDLNKNLARDDFEEARKILEEFIGKFPKNSVYEKSLNDLLTKTKNSLEKASGVNMVDATPADDKDSMLLSEALKNAPLFVTQDEKNIYGISQDTVFIIDKKSKSKKDFIPNKNHWLDVGGLGVYLGNIYVLDKKEGQIFKFPGSGFTKSNYLVGGTQDFSNASSLAIDGSIWILFKNGDVKKFTRGKADELTISGLDKKLKEPSRIFSDADTDNVYILDNGNSRIVVLAKNGVYQTQYQTPILKDAKEFDVREKEKKIFVLSGSKIWQIDL